jgi:hypothetical protein
MIHALRTGQITGTIESILRDAASRPYPSLQWARPDQPVLNSISVAKRLELDKPAARCQLHASTKQASLLAGLVGKGGLTRISSHSYRKGMITEAHHIQLDHGKPAGAVTHAVAQAAGHSHTAFTKGITEKYNEGITEQIWNKRAQMQRQNRNDSLAMDESLLHPRLVSRDVTAYMQEHGIGEDERDAARKQMKRKRLEHDLERARPLAARVPTASEFVREALAPKSVNTRSANFKPVQLQARTQLMSHTKTTGLHVMQTTGSAVTQTTGKMPMRKEEAILTGVETIQQALNDTGGKSKQYVADLAGDDLETVVIDPQLLDDAGAELDQYDNELADDDLANVIIDSQLVGDVATGSDQYDDGLADDDLADIVIDPQLLSHAGAASIEHDKDLKDELADIEVDEEQLAEVLGALNMETCETIDEADLAAHSNRPDQAVDALARPTFEAITRLSRINILQQTEFARHWLEPQTRIDYAVLEGGSKAPTTPLIVQCAQCDFTCTSRAAFMEEHIRMWHTYEDQPPPRKRDRVGPLLCYICKAYCAGDNESLEFHLEQCGESTSHEELGDETGLGTSGETGRDSILSKQIGPSMNASTGTSSTLFICDIIGCGKPYQTEKSLANHKLDVHNWSGKVCEHGCDPQKLYLSKSTYNSHIRTYHLQASFVAMACPWPGGCTTNTTLKTQATLVKHYRIYHDCSTNDIAKQQITAHSGYSFTTAAQLIANDWIMISCPLCDVDNTGKSYGSASAFKNHLNACKSLGDEDKQDVFNTVVAAMRVV